MSKLFLDHLFNFVTENKQTLFNQIITERTRHVTVVLENIFQPQNASAVIRSCDVFGIQDLHVIENDNKYNLNPKVVLGASKWVNLFKYNRHENNTLNCINQLKKQGYKIYATTPHTNDMLISDVPLDEKCAFMFGTELTGLSETAMQNADGFVKIPMYGFTESLNISVSAAILLYEVSKRLKESNINWQLSDEEKIEQLLIWAKKVVKNSDLIENEFKKKSHS
ncbi:MAG: RNA methyltransferase [Flavobacteriales bacterium]|nr:RNA methyltransferase [Flavobacteriales bacterium]MCB9334908.1 RNA methyltransferase [Flavobacteriales bacterium]